MRVKEVRLNFFFILQKNKTNFKKAIIELFINDAVW